VSSSLVEGFYLSVESVRMTDEMAMRLLQATREQLHGKPTREVEPFEIAQKAGINPFSREYETAIGYLLDHGYIEHYPNEATRTI
jgi:inorganic pyrophosphatase